MLYPISFTKALEIKATVGKAQELENVSLHLSTLS